MTHRTFDGRRIATMAAANLGAILGGYLPGCAPTPPRSNGDQPMTAPRRRWGRKPPVSRQWRAIASLIEHGISLRRVAEITSPQKARAKLAQPSPRKTSKPVEAMERKGNKPMNREEAILTLKAVAALAAKLASDVERGRLWEGDYSAAVARLAAYIRDLPPENGRR